MTDKIVNSGIRTSNDSVLLVRSELFFWSTAKTDVCKFLRSVQLGWGESLSMATNQICLNQTNVLVVVSRICCSFRDNKNRFWIQLCCATGKSVWVNRISGLSFLLCSDCASRPLCTDLVCPFLSEAEAVNEDALLLQLLKVRHCLCEASLGCDNKIGFGEWVSRSLQPVLTNLGLITSPGNTGRYDC